MITSINSATLIGGIDHDMVKALKTLMVNVAEFFGADNKRANREMEEVIKFEIHLAKVFTLITLFLINFLNHRLRLHNYKNRIGCKLFFGS